MDEGNVTIEIRRIAKELNRLQDERSKNKKVKIFTRLLILVVFVTFMLLLYKQYTAFDMGKVTDEVMKEMAAITPKITDESFNVVKSVYPVYVEEIQKQIKEREESLLTMVQNEANVFLRIADHDISAALHKGYPILLQKQKEHLYDEFPGLRDNGKVDKAIDNIIAKGGPKLQQILQNKFDRHQNILYNLNEKLSKLEDEKMKADKYLAQKTLGITLELVGRKLQKIDKEDN